MDRRRVNGTAPQSSPRTSCNQADHPRKRARRTTKAPKVMLATHIHLRARARRPHTSASSRRRDTNSTKAQSTIAIVAKVAAPRGRWWVLVMRTSPSRDRGAISITALSQLARADSPRLIKAPLLFACSVMDQLKSLLRWVEARDELVAPPSGEGNHGPRTSDMHARGPRGRVEQNSRAPPSPSRWSRIRSDRNSREGPCQ